MGTGSGSSDGAPIILHGTDELLVEQDLLHDGEITLSVQERAQYSQPLGSFLPNLVDVRRQLLNHLNCTCLHVFLYAQGRNYVNSKIWVFHSDVDEDSSLLGWEDCFWNTLKMGPGISSETLVTISKSTPHNIPKDLNLQFRELLERRLIAVNGWTDIFTCMSASVCLFSRYLWLVLVYHGLDIFVAVCWLICLNSHQMIHWPFP